VSPFTGILEFDISGSDLKNNKKFAECLLRAARRLSTDPMFLHWCVLRALSKRSLIDGRSPLFETTWSTQINVTFSSLDRIPRPSKSCLSYALVNFRDIPQAIGKSAD
jgi:hypothetical protein